ncbi:MAG: hypothetical protein IPG34_12085 [Rhodocyclaceae bacterium]|nr:hypothetical protein [Rhodocyclaceae bacterium]
MGKRTELNTVRVAPLSMARSAVARAVDRVRQAVDVVQAVRSAVKSVDVHSEPVEVDYTRKVISSSAVRIVPAGNLDIGILGGLQLHNDDNTVTLALKFDAYLIDRSAAAPRGNLFAEASCRMNSQVRVVLRETIDALPVPPPKAKPRRLPCR